MDVLTATTIYWKCVFAQENIQLQILELAKKLCNDNPAKSVNPESYLKREDLKNPNQGLLATLYSEVDRQEYQENFPITRPESKNAARNLLNAGREFYINIANLSDQNKLNISLQNIINQWNSYKQTYLSGDFFGKINAEKSNFQNPESYKKWDDRYYFWQDIVDMIDKSILKINDITKEYLSGNSNNPFQTETI
jgi:hypothetical protein